MSHNAIDRPGEEQRINTINCEGVFVSEKKIKWLRIGLKMTHLDDEIWERTASSGKSGRKERKDKRETLDGV